MSRRARVGERRAWRYIARWNERQAGAQEQNEASRCDGRHDESSDIWVHEADEVGKVETERRAETGIRWLDRFEMASAEYYAPTVGVHRNWPRSLLHPQLEIRQMRTRIKVFQATRSAAIDEEAIDDWLRQNENIVVVGFSVAVSPQRAGAEGSGPNMAVAALLYQEPQLP
jgi:hypothetical protein